MKAQVQENSEFVTSIDNYTMEMEMKLSVSGIETSTTTIGTIDEKHQKQYLEATYTAMGMSMGTTKMYVDFDSGYTYTTMLYQGETWYKQKGASSIFDMQQILKQLTSMKDVVDNGNGNYTVTVTPDDYKGLMNGSEVDTSMLTGSMKAEVQTSNGYITQIDYDFSDMIKGFDYFKATVKFSNYNEAGDVELPTEIYEEAVDM
jgi:hypothetical protein